jgi:Tfp pilus assembly protein PilO
MKLVLPRWNRRLPLALAALVFAAANLVFFLTYRSSTNERAAALESRRDELARTVASREAEAEKLAGQKERLSGVSEAMEEFYGRRVGTQDETLAGLVADLHTILQEAGIEANQISYATAPVAKLPLTRMRVGFSVKCDYGRFKKLLRIFEQSRRWIAVESVAIRRDTEQPGSVYVQVDLATYFTEPEEAPPSPPGAKAPAPPSGAPARRAVPAARVTG